MGDALVGWKGLLELQGYLSDGSDNSQSICQATLLLGATVAAEKLPGALADGEQPNTAVCYSSEHQKQGLSAS